MAPSDDLQEQSDEAADTAGASEEDSERLGDAADVAREAEDAHEEEQNG